MAASTPTDGDGETHGVGRAVRPKRGSLHSLYKVDEFLRLPRGQRERIVVLSDRDAHDLVWHEGEVGECPRIVWEHDFNTRDTEKLAKWWDEWQRRDWTDAAERATRRLFDGCRHLRRFTDNAFPVAFSAAWPLVVGKFGVQLRTVYQLHPQDETSYLPLGVFYAETVEERFYEVLRLLASLGATTIEAKYDKVALARVGFNAEAAARKVAIAGTVEEADTDERVGVVRMEFPPESRTVSMPKDLLWYGAERSWQVLADARRKHGVTRYQCEVSVRETHGITAKLCANLLDVGLQVGGSFQEVQSTTIRYDVEFFPRQRPRAQRKATSPG